MDYKDKYIGINLGHHDSSLCLLEKVESSDDYCLTVYEEERFQKNKKIGFFPYLSVKKLEETHSGILKNISQKKISFTTFMTSMEKTWEFINKANNKFAKAIGIPKELEVNNQHPNIIHHEAHLFSTLITLDPKQDHLILIADGCGSNKNEFETNALFPFKIDADKDFYESISVYSYINGKIEVVSKFFAPLYMSQHLKGKYSPASFFTACSMVVFADWSYAGKVMGLAGYHEGEIFNKYELFDKLLSLEKETNTGKEHFDNLDPKKRLLYEKLCASTQVYFEKYFTEIINDLKQNFPNIDSLAFTGGCALNCIFNEKLRKKKVFKNIHVPAWPNDEGVSIGAAVANFYIQNKKLPTINKRLNPFLGIKPINQPDVQEVFKEFKIQKYSHDIFLKHYRDEEVIAWFQSNSECGPRALGHRTIICSPYIKGIKQYLNDHIKFREEFRPYGCSVLTEQMSYYFENTEELYSPYMSFAPIVKEEHRESLKEIMHIDNSIRIQTVDESFDKFYELLVYLKREDKHSLVIHTSLNINKQPILESINDAYLFFTSSEIKVLCLNDFIITK